MLTTSITLLERLRQGDEAAWQLWLRRYPPFLKVILRRCGVREHDLDDLIQIVILRLYRKIGVFQRRATGSLRKWLSVVATREAIRHLRREQRFTQSGSAAAIEMLQQVADPNSDFSHELDREAVADLLQGLLAELQGEVSDVHWRAFWMTQMEERTAQEASDELGLTVGAIYAAVSRLKARLCERSCGLLDD